MALSLNPSQPTRPSDGEDVDSEAATGEPARPTLAGSPVLDLSAPHARARMVALVLLVGGVLAAFVAGVWTAVGR